ALRQPTPMFGDGYIQLVQDSDITLNQNSNLAQKQALGILGHPNVNGDGSFRRLGWKAQWRSLLPAVAAEESVQLGITTDIFPSESDQTPGCVNPTPEDGSNYAFAPSTNAPWTYL